MRKAIEVFWITAAICRAASAATIGIDPVAPAVGVGSPVSLAVGVSGISDLYAFQFDIGFDPLVLSASSVTEGGLFSGLSVLFNPGFIDNLAGSITFVADSLSGFGAGISTDGTLVLLSFEAIAPGNSRIELSNIILLDSNLNDIAASTERATVAVGGTSAVPEPATVPLIMVPLLVLVATVRRK